MHVVCACHVVRACYLVCLHYDKLCMHDDILCMHVGILCMHVGIQQMHADIGHVGMVLVYQARPILSPFSVIAIYMLENIVHVKFDTDQPHKCVINKNASRKMMTEKGCKRFN